jgi:tRNA uridine 5-carbamoylmethylation protein Kti12
MKMANILTVSCLQRTLQVPDTRNYIMPFHNQSKLYWNVMKKKVWHNVIQTSERAEVQLRRFNLEPNELPSGFCFTCILKVCSFWNSI